MTSSNETCLGSRVKKVIGLRVGDGAVDWRAVNKTGAIVALAAEEMKKLSGWLNGTHLA